MRVPGEPVSDRLEDWAPRVYRFALRLTADLHAAEDITQETFLRAWRQRQRLRDPTAARVWLFRIAANLWRDRLRRGRSPVSRAEPLDNETVDMGRPPESLVAGREDLARALDALDALPPRQRNVLYLSACEGLPAAEVAEILNITADAAKASLSVARKKLREQLPDLLPDRPSDDR